MQDKSIDSALQALHRAGGQQGDLARQILALRGVNPIQKRRRTPAAFKRGKMRLAILEALRDGPKTHHEITLHVQGYKPEWTFEDAKDRVSATLTKMRAAGRIKYEGKLWLAP